MRVLAQVAFAFAALALAVPAGATVDGGDQPYYIGLQDRLLTDVYLNGLGPYTFVIDTASSRTVIYEHLRGKLGLKASGPEPIMVYGINDVAPAMAVKPSILRVAGQDITDLEIGVLPDSREQGDPDGVLGIDVLSRYLVVLDRGTMRMKLLPRGSEAVKAFAGWNQLQLLPRPLNDIKVDFWYITTDFNGHPIPTLFDLGAGMTLLNWEAAERLGLDKRNLTNRYGPPPEGLRDVLGKVAPAVVAKEVRIRFNDQQAWPQQDVLVSDAPVFEFFGMGHLPGAIVGPGLLKDNSMAIDFLGHKLYVGPHIDN